MPRAASSPSNSLPRSIVAARILACALLACAGGVRAQGGPGEAACTADTDVTTLPSAYSVQQTVDRLKASIETSGLSVVAVLDQAVPSEEPASEAHHDETLIVGHPRLRGLLSETPALALDLPVKVLVWEDGDGVKVSFKEAECLGQRYDLGPEALAYFARVEESAERALQQ